MRSNHRTTGSLGRLAVVGAASSAAVGASYLGLVSGALTVDLGVGRRTRPLGPLSIEVSAPRSVVYDVATAPYAVRRSRAMQQKVDILERADGMVLAAHRTALGNGLTAVTVETVTFEPPGRIGFRLVRGPVPHVAETFDLEERGEVTVLTYTGELGTDLWRVGAAWGDVVAGAWVATVRASLDEIKSESERRAR